ncbi:MAG: hypothetical protein LQ338_008001, partial [Usnochroma carphineum]
MHSSDAPSKLSRQCTAKAYLIAPSVRPQFLSFPQMGFSQPSRSKSPAADNGPDTEENTNASIAPTSSGQACPSCKASQNHSPAPHLSPNLSIEPITPSTVPSFRRLISLLLPIRYPDKFFADSIADVTSSSLARVAIWHERPRPRPAKRKREEESTPAPGLEDAPLIPSSGYADSIIQPEIDITTPPAPGTIIGGIQCRIEHLPFHPSQLPDPPPKLPSSSSSEAMKKYCYIQTLALLSPYRSQGIATALLDTIVATLCTEGVYEGAVSAVYAHVWEANEEALEWYVKRGFRVGEGV